MITIVRLVTMSPYKDITWLLTIVTRCILYPWLSHFVTRSLYLLISFTYFCLPPTPFSPLATTCLFSLSVDVLLCLSIWCAFSDSIYEWNHTACVFFCLISLSTTPFRVRPWLSTTHSRPTHVVANGKISFFLFKGYYYIVYMVHIHSPNVEHVRLLPYLDYCK